MKDFYFEQSIAEYVGEQQKSGKAAFAIGGLITLVCLIFSPKVYWTVTIILIAFIFYSVFRENKTLQQIKKCPQEDKWEISLKGSR